MNSLFGGVLFHSDDASSWSGEAREQYRQLLRIREAAKIRVHADEGLSVSYELDGERHTLVIE